MNILIIRPRSVFARVEYEPIHFLKWTELDPTNNYFFLVKSVNKVIKKYGNNFPSNMTLIEGKPYFDTEFIAEKEFFLDNLLSTHKFDKLIAVHTDIRNNIMTGKEDVTISSFHEYFTAEKIPTFTSHRLVMDAQYPIIYLANKIADIAHIYVDPQEADWSKILNKSVKKFYFYKTSTSIVADYLPYAEYSFFRESQGTLLLEKSNDFVFGFKVSRPEREHFYNLIKPQIDLLEVHKSIKFMIDYKKIKINDTVNRLTYKDLLNKSKWTLVINSYEYSHFSAIRFWDALFKKCIPLTLKGAPYAEMLSQYPEILKIYDEYLSINIEDLNTTIRSLNYEETLQKIYDTSDWQKLQTSKWYLTKMYDYYTWVNN